MLALPSRSENCRLRDRTPARVIAVSAFVPSTARLLVTRVIRFTLTDACLQFSSTRFVLGRPNAAAELCRSTAALDLAPCRAAPKCRHKPPLSRTERRRRTGYTTLGADVPR